MKPVFEKGNDEQTVRYCERSLNLHNEGVTQIESAESLNRREISDSYCGRSLNTHNEGIANLI